MTGHGGEAVSPRHREGGGGFDSAASFLSSPDVFGALGHRAWVLAKSFPGPGKIRKAQVQERLADFPRSPPTVHTDNPVKL
jgi:hypothetical protein